MNPKSKALHKSKQDKLDKKYGGIFSIERKYPEIKERFKKIKNKTEGIGDIKFTSQ